MTFDFSPLELTVGTKFTASCEVGFAFMKYDESKHSWLLYFQKVGECVYGWSNPVYWKYDDDMDSLGDCFGMYGNNSFSKKFKLDTIERSRLVTDIN